MQQSRRVRQFKQMVSLRNYRRQSDSPPHSLHPFHYEQMSSKLRFCLQTCVHERSQEDLAIIHQPDVTVDVCKDYNAVTSYTSQGSKKKIVLLKFGAPSIWRAEGYINQHIYVQQMQREPYADNKYGTIIDDGTNLRFCSTDHDGHDDNTCTAAVTYTCSKVLAYPVKHLL